MDRSGSKAEPPPSDADLANAVTAVLLHSEAIRQHLARGSGSGGDIDRSAGHIIRNVRRIWAQLGEGAVPPASSRAR